MLGVLPVVVLAMVSIILLIHALFFSSAFLAVARDLREVLREGSWRDRFVATAFVSLSLIALTYSVLGVAALVQGYLEL